MADPEKPRRRSPRPKREAEGAAPGAELAGEALDAPAPARSRTLLPIVEERAPRQALLLGGGLLVVGLAIVGTGLGGLGAVVALVGLAALIYGIHAFGRLGAEDVTPGSLDEVARASAWVRLTLGLVVAVVGLAVAIAGYLGLAPPGSIEAAVIAFVGGGFWSLRAAQSLSPANKTHSSA